MARFCKACQMTVSETGWIRVAAGRYDRELKASAVHSDWLPLSFLPYGRNC